MTAGALITTDLQLELRGVLFGPGSSFQFTEEGLDGLGVPTLRTSERARPQDHGVFAAQTFMGERVLDWTLHVLAADQAELVDRLIELTAAFAPSSAVVEPLAVRVGGRVFLLFGRPDRVSSKTELLPGGYAEAACRFIATDPRLYSQILNEASTALGGTTGGLGFPHGAPHGFGTVTPGVATVFNAGNVPTAPTVRFSAAAPISNPRVTNVATGEFVEARTTVAAGQTLTLDFAERAATLNGSVSRTGTIRRPQSRWFALPPGSTSLRFSASAGAGQMTVAWRDAFLI